MQTDLKKENTILKEYINALERLVRATGEERRVLFREMNNINQENLHLSSKMSSPIIHNTFQTEAYELEEKLNEEYLKNMELNKEIYEIGVEREQLLNYLQALKGRNQSLEAEISQIKKEAQEKMELQAELQNKREEVQQFKLLLVEKEESAVTLEELIKQLNNQKQITTLTLQRYQQSTQQAKQLYEDSLSKMTLQIAALKEQNNILIKGRQELMKCVEILSRDKAELKNQIDFLSKGWQSSKKEVEELSIDIKQIITEKMQRAKKSKTQFSNIHCEFSNAFNRLKLQIETIKSDPQTSDEPPSPTTSNQPKEILGTGMASPSKWKSVEGKLLMLRSTQSSSRFR